jgi:hypothetical protein
VKIANTTSSPLIAILSHLTERETADAPKSLPLPDKKRNDPLTIHFLYSTRVPSQPSASSDKHETVTDETLRQILFLPRLHNIVERVSSSVPHLQISFDLFLTNLSSSAVSTAAKLLRDGSKDDSIRVHNRRITGEDLYAATTGDVTAPPHSTVCYVCGPPPMTDEFVKTLGTLVGSERVLCEKWW